MEFMAGSSQGRPFIPIWRISQTLKQTGFHAETPEVCMLLKCQTPDLETCGEPVGSAFTKFEDSLSGTFGTSYVFPQIILSGSQLAPEGHCEVDYIFWLNTQQEANPVLREPGWASGVKVIKM
ncbi:pantetheine hydrolase VNN2-like isoform X2 [Bos mutus]|uniref:pantetheine hydrolase VNN2-like isoform X2 n=1 Tax=Bos mutus TaxID=72004 RepID=UPI0038B5DF35